jgi:Xaa-Pro aminopeptidase
MQPTFFVSNRDRIAAGTNGGLIVVSAYTQMQRGNDAAFQFEQDANFWWLTGIEAPDWWVIIDGSSSKQWLVSPHISHSNQIFNGSLDDEVAKKMSGIKTVISSDEAEKLLRELAKKHSVVHTIGEPQHAEHFDFMLNPAQKKTRLMLERIFNDVQDCQLEFSKLRAIKQPEEIVAIKKAIKLTAKAFEDVKVLLPDLKSENEIEAEFTYAFRRAGATGHAYDPIVGSGKNACILHYNTNSDKLKKSQLVLIDIGARIGGYPADITRTFAYGEPTNRQRAVHEAVQRAHTRIIQLLGPGVEVSTYSDQVDEIMKAALTELGLMTGPDKYREYFPHAISHGLGIDVHDSLGRPSQFQPGMILTVEPGIYIPEEGIGVRIEDDILITDTGRQNLSAALSIRL